MKWVGSALGQLMNRGHYSLGTFTLATDSKQCRPLFGAVLFFRPVNSNVLILFQTDTPLCMFYAGHLYICKRPLHMCSCRHVQKVCPSVFCIPVPYSALKAGTCFLQLVRLKAKRIKTRGGRSHNHGPIKCGRPGRV